MKPACSGPHKKEINKNGGSMAKEAQGSSFEVLFN